MCADLGLGTYAVSLIGNELTLTPEDDQCDGRIAVLSSAPELSSQAPAPRTIQAPRFEVDARGNLYTAETYSGARLQRFLYKGVGAVPRSQGVPWPRGR